jgi:hypothetical protein
MLATFRRRLANRCERIVGHLRTHPYKTDIDVRFALYQRVFAGVA